MKIGDKVFLTKKHPWGEAIGVYVRNDHTLFGMKPIVKIDNGQEVYVMREEQWRLI
jgi:hypothetical protein